MNQKYPSWEEIRKSIFIEKRSFPQLDAQTPSFFGVPVALDKADIQGADFVIIGAPFVFGWTDEFIGLSRSEWQSVAQRVRQQSIRYPSGYVLDLDLDIFEHAKVVDYGDATVAPELASQPGSIGYILAAQAAVEAKVADALAAGAVPIVFGGWAPTSAYAIAKPLAESTPGKIGMVCLDAHWDSQKMDFATLDPRIAGAGNWKDFLYREHKNFDWKYLVEIGERGFLESKDIIRPILAAGATFVPAFRLHGDLGIQGTVDLLPKAFNGTEAVFVHLDMDCMGGSSPAAGDLYGELGEPMGMTDHEVIRIAYETGKLGADALSYASIIPNSPMLLRAAVYSIMYFIAGHIEGGKLKRK